MMKKVIGADTKSFLAVILVLTIVAVLLIAYKPMAVGAFTAKGLEWENRTEVIATSEQPVVTQHIIFGDSRPANCTDGVYVESNGLAVPFSTANEVYGNGVCAETDVVINNDIFKIPEQQTAKPLISITGAQTAETRTYDIYYGLIETQQTAQPTAPLENIIVPQEKPDTLNFTIGSAATSENSSPSEWDMRGRFLNHTAYNPIDGPTNLSANVTYFNIGDITQSSPAVSNGIVYIGSNDFKVYALNASNIMQNLGSYTTGANIFSSPAVANGVVYVGSEDNKVYALNASNISQKLGSYTTGNFVYSSPAVSNGIVYIGSNDFKVYALNASNISQKLGSYTTGSFVMSSPAVANGIVYVGSHDTKVYALNASNISQKLGSYTTGDVVESSPAVANGIVYVGSDDGKVYALNASNISQKLGSYTTNNLGYYVQSSPAVANGIVYIGSQDGNVYALNASNISQKLGSYTTGSIITYSSPAVANGVVYVGSWDINVYALNASNVSQKLGSYTAGNSVSSSPAVASGIVYVGSDDGHVYAFGSSTQVCSIMTCSNPLCTTDPVCQPIYTKFSGTTTNFTAVSNITNVPSCTLEDPTHGKIIWSSNVNAAGANFDANVNIGQNFVSVNSAAMDASFNSSAEISLYGITCPVAAIYEAVGSFSTAPDVIDSGFDCVASGDCTIVSCSAGILKFDVNHFTGYAIGTTANLTIFDDTDTLGGSQIRYPGDTVKFFANYSNTSSLPITGATCLANYTDSFNNAMTYNATSKFYEYSRTFSSAGIYDWNVTCNKTGYDTLQANDTVNISVSFAPPPPITACTNITYSGIWKLNNSIFSSPASACINITANDVTLNCTGYTIEGQNTAGTIGISAKNVKNLLIDNCLVKGWGYGILFANTNSSSIINSNVYDAFNVNPNIVSIYLNYSNNINITNDKISNSTNYGVYGNSCNNITFSRNNISYSNVYSGIYLNASNYDIFDSNTIYRNTFSGISLDNSGYANFTNNTIYNNLVDGIGVSGIGPCNFVNNTVRNNLGVGISPTSGSTVANNTILNNDKGIVVNSFTSVSVLNNNITNNTRGVYVQEASACTISKNVMNNNNYGVDINGLYYGGAANANVSSNVITNSSAAGINITGCVNNTIYNNTVINSTNGIYLLDTRNNNISNNWIYNNTNAGITAYTSGYLSGSFSTSYNNIQNSTFAGNGYAGINIRNSSYNNLTNNTLYNNTWDFVSNETSVGNNIYSTAFNNTVVNFTYGPSINIKGNNGSSSPNPTSYVNISHYLNISGVTGYAPWNSTFGTSGAEHGYSVQQTSDGGYIIAGQSNVSTYYSSILLLKMNLTGGQVWNKTFGYYGDVQDFNIGYSAQQTSDGGYILAGTVGAGTAGTYAILIKTNSTGDQLWNKTFGYYGIFYSVKQLNDSGYIAVGYNYTNNGDLFLAKINSSGSTVWYNSYDYGGTEYGRSVVQTNDSGFAIAGYTTNGTSGSTDALILKTNSTGYTLWEKILGGAGTDEGLGIVEEQDASHHLDMTGFITGANRNCSLIRVTADSLSYTNYSYGGTANDECNSITAGPSGDVMLTGYTKSSGAGGADVWLLRVNATSGVVAWNKTFGGTSDDTGYSVITASDGGYAVAGDTASFGAGSYDVWLIKAYEPGTPTISSWINVNVSYSDLDIVGVRDSSLFIARNNGTWETNTSKFASNYGVDTAAKVVYANITNFGSIFAPLGESTIVNNCANLTVANTAYVLGTNLSGLQAGRNVCIDVQANNVTLNCNNHNMSGPSTGYGINIVGRNNTIISNCIVYAYDSNIYADNTNYSTIDNNWLVNASTSYGIELDNGWHNRITSNHLNYFLAISSGGDSYIYGNTLSGDSGMRVSTEYNDTFSSNVIIGNPNEGLVGISLAFNTTNSTVFNNTISGMTANYQAGINIDVDSKYNNLTYNNITDCHIGIGMRYGAIYDNIVHNWITNNSKGVWVSDDLGASYNNTFYDNYLNNTVNVDDSSTGNLWNTTYNCSAGQSIVGGCMGGNFWSNYGGHDTGVGTYPYNISGDGIGDTNIPFHTNISTGGDYLPLVPVTPIYNLTVYINYVQTTVFNYTGVPYSVKVNVTNSTGSPQQNVLVGIEEANGWNNFLPLLDKGYIYNGQAYALSDSNGIAEFIIAPTQYAMPPFYGYSISAVVLDSSLDVTQRVNLTIADASSLNVRGTYFANQDLLKTRAENMLKIVSNLKAWVDARMEREVNITVYLNGTYDSPPDVLVGAIHRVNITLINESSGLPVAGDIVPVELNGYLLDAINVPGAAGNTQNFAQGIKTGQIFYIVPSKYALTPYDKLIFDVSNGGSDVATINMSIDSAALLPPSDPNAAAVPISDPAVASAFKAYADNMIKVIANIKLCLDTLPPI